MPLIAVCTKAFRRAVWWHGVQAISMAGGDHLGYREELTSIWIQVCQSEEKHAYGQIHHLSLCPVDCCALDLAIRLARGHRLWAAGTPCPSESPKRTNL